MNPSESGNAATAPRRVLVAGSRSWQNLHKIRMRLLRLPATATIVHGGAPGADRAAGWLAEDFGFQVEEHPADWEKHGKRAGFLRNVEMLDSGVDLVLAFWDGESRGTKHTIDEARKRGIPVEIVTP